MSCVSFMKAGWDYLHGYSIFFCLFLWTERFTNKLCWTPTVPLWGNKAPENSAAARHVSVMWCPIAYSTVRGSEHENLMEHCDCYRMTSFACELVTLTGCAGSGALDLSNLHVRWDFDLCHPCLELVKWFLLITTTCQERFARFPFWWWTRDSNVCQFEVSQSISHFYPGGSGDVVLWLLSIPLI